MGAEGGIEAWHAVLAGLSALGGWHGQRYAASRKGWNAKQALEAHENLCGERHQRINKRLKRIEKKLDKLALRKQELTTSQQVL